MAKLDEERKRFLFETILNAGFPYGEDVIHLFVGGSELHGAKLHETDDLDIYGLFIEPAKFRSAFNPVNTLFGPQQGMNVRMVPMTSM
jgi:hypothetical protein